MQDYDLFLKNLCLVLSHTVVYEARSEAPYGFDPLGLDQTRMHLQGAEEGSEHATNAFTTRLPEIIKAIADQYGVLDTAQATAAGPVAQQQAQITRGLIPAYQQIATEANAAQNAVNPEAGALRTTATQSLTDLLKAFGTAGLTPAEQAAAERAVNYASASRGNIDKTSSIGTVQNALGFDDHRQAKLKNLESAIQTATSFLPASQVGQVNVAQSAQNATAPGSFAYNTGQSTNQLGSQWLSGALGLQQQYANLNAQLPSVQELVGQYVNNIKTLSSAAGGFGGM